MGGISIFSMHYLGNQAILLGDGDIVLQIAYNPAYMALSMFVPIIALLVAFITVGSNEKVSWLRVTVGGTLAGLAMLSMHFLGQAGIRNYTVEYQIGNVVGSGIIAVGATTAALSVFFLLRATWTASWWKRALTAVLLAGAVSGMHWAAELGTHYRLKGANASADTSMSRNSTVIIVIVLVGELSTPL
jgi:NO-binding membrane sensor protein with MHYT domain